MKLALPPSPVANALGYAGLIPFLGLALAVWFGPADYQPLAIMALLGYGASILSFLGAIYWGLGMREPGLATPALWVWGVIPSLIAWVALLVPPFYGLAFITAGLVVCLMVDALVYPRLAVQAWLPMRRVLTAVAVLCCNAAAWKAIA